MARRPDPPPGAESVALQGAPDDATNLSLREPLPLAPDAFFVPTDDPKHPRVRYVDGQLSRNDSCMVLLGNKLNRRIPPVYVNGQPLGFC